jgi:hypothetical protein
LRLEHFREGSLALLGHQAVFVHACCWRC